MSSIKVVTRNNQLKDEPSIMVYHDLDEENGAFVADSGVLILKCTKRNWLKVYAADVWYSVEAQG